MKIRLSLKLNLKLGLSLAIFMFLSLFKVYLIDKLFQLQSAHASYFWVDIYHNLATVADIQAISRSGPEL